jgi:hypothetical protein
MKFEIYGKVLLIHVKFETSFVLYGFTRFFFFEAIINNSHLKIEIEKK